MNATLEAIARAIFRSWFVDFDPVRANMDRHGSGRGRGQKSEIGRVKSEMVQPSDLSDFTFQSSLFLSPATAALFPDSFQDSPIGHIPKGWEVCSLANKIELLSGGTPKTSEPDYWDGDIPWYSVKDSPSETDVWVIQTEKRVTKLGIENSAAQVLPEGTTIISARGTVGKLALVGTPMAMNQSCYGVRGAKGNADYFTYFALRQATADLQQRTHGTVFDTITRQTFKTLDCIFPPAPMTQAFDRTVAPLLVQIRANLHQSHTLATLRDTLLPKLLSGELSVGNEVLQP
jgi:type I restriction enzyme, S subunit